MIIYKIKIIQSYNKKSKINLNKKIISSIIVINFQTKKINDQIVFRVPKF